MTKDKVFLFHYVLPPLVLIATLKCIRNIFQSQHVTEFNVLLHYYHKRFVKNPETASFKNITFELSESVGLYNKTAP